MAYAKFKNDPTSVRAKSILSELTRGYPRKNINVLLIGKPGTGKSTLINSLFTALDETGYHEWARHGSHEGRQPHLTLCLRRYQLYENYLSDPETVEYVNKIKCRPCLWDCPGLQDANDENLREILDLLIKGCIKDRTFIIPLRDLSTVDLHEKYIRYACTGREVNLAIFVHTWDEEVPENLLKVVNVIQEKDVPILLAMTKLDKAKNEEKLKEFDEKCREVAAILGMVGTTERTFKLSLYCGEATPKLKRVKEIDEELCRLWEAIMDPAYIGVDPLPPKPPSPTPPPSSRCTVM